MNTLDCWQFGKVLVESGKYERGKKGNTQLVKKLAEDLNVSPAFIYHTTKFYGLYKTLEQVQQACPAEKFSWSKIVKYVLPVNGDVKVAKDIARKNSEEYHHCPVCGKGHWGTVSSKFKKRELGFQPSYAMV